MPILKKIHDAGKGVIGMKLIGEGTFDAQQREANLRYRDGPRLRRRDDRRLREDRASRRVQGRREAPRCIAPAEDSSEQGVALSFRPSDFRDIVSGRRRGVAAASLLCAASSRGRRVSSTPPPCGGATAATIAARPTVHRVGVPVVSVGNLTLGGTGKTPLVRWLARWFPQRGVRVAVVSRGYGRQGGPGRTTRPSNCGRSLPDVPHVQNPDRVAAARSGRRRSSSRQLIVLDDGFQHRRHRPRPGHRAAGRPGAVRLRPRVSARNAARAGRTGCGGPTSWSSPAPICSMRRSARPCGKPSRQYAPQAVRAEVVHAPRRLVSASRRREPLGCACAASRWRLFAASAIRPAFATRWKPAAAASSASASFPTITATRRPTSTALSAWADGLGVSAVLCTGKDLVKIVRRPARRPSALGRRHRAGVSRRPGIARIAIAAVVPRCYDPGKNKWINCRSEDRHSCLSIADRQECLSS